MSPSKSRNTKERRHWRQSQIPATNRGEDTPMERLSPRPWVPPPLPNRGIDIFLPAAILILTPSPPEMDHGNPRPRTDRRHERAEPKTLLYCLRRQGLRREQKQDVAQGAPYADSPSRKRSYGLPPGGASRGGSPGALPQIGIVRAVEPEPKALDHHPLIARLLDNSFLKRHPHPMVVHFPIALMICAVLFYAAYLVCGSASLESTAFHCLAAGTFFSMPAIATGYLTWKLNYGGKPIRPVRIKILLSWILLPAALLLCVWRAADPAISQTETAMAAIYGLLLFLSALLVSIIGWYGGRLIFPSESGSAGAW